MDNEKTYKKYLLIEECCGTKPYLTEKLEMDIEDIIEYTIIPKENIDDHDIIKILYQSDDKDELIELRNLYQEEEWYYGR